MSETTKIEALLRILDQLPGMPCSTRIDPATMSSEWVYVSPRMAELFAVSDEELRRDPSR